MDSREVLPAGMLLDASYRIMRVVGSGGFGITYEAEDINLGTMVAIKEYYPFDFAERAGTMSVRPRSDRHKKTFDWGRSNFLREARTLARFEHPSIVRVTRVFEANSTAYMVMRFERGDSFEDWLQGLGRPPTQEELDQVVGPLLDALEILHAADFLHRDIAPDNIIVHADGTPVLLDFGAARRAVAEKSQALTGIVKAGYSPHEQYSSDGRLQGPWTDIYALGGTLYRAVVGRLPEEATLRFDEDRMPPAALVAQGQFRPGFLAAIDACLKVRPAERPQSVATLRPMLLQEQRRGSLNRLVGALRSASTVRPPATTTSFAQAQGASRWPIVAAALLVIVGGTYGGYQYVHWQPAERGNGDLEVRRAAEEAAKQRAALEAEKQRWEAQEAARRRAMLEAEKQRQEAEEAARRRAALEAEKQRQEAKAAAKRRAALEAEKQRQEAEAAAKRRAALEAEKQRQEAEEAAKRRAALEAEKQRQEAEEAARRRAALEAEKQRQEAEEAARRRAALEAEKQRQEAEEAAKRRVALETEQRRKAEIERERALFAQKVFKDCGTCPEMVPIPTGEFLMGSSKADIESGAATGNEGPQRKIALDRPLAASRFEVTKDQFEAFVWGTGHKIGGTCWTLEGNEPKERDGRSFRNPGYAQIGTHPAVCVSWEDAKAYVSWLSKTSGKPYRLLSEAEWEYVARAGATGRYPTAGTEAELCASGNGADQAASAAELPASWDYLRCNDGHARTAPVGSFKPNAFGVFDVMGNAWEWVEDCYAESLAETPADGRARMPGDCRLRAVRGGSWSATARMLRAAVRGKAPAGSRFDDVGFRVARALAVEP